MTSVFDAGGLCLFGNKKRHAEKLDLMRDGVEFVSEFVGTMLFAFFGGLAGSSGFSAAAGNGVALAVLVYATASVSGGKLNPGVSLSLFLVNAYPMSVHVPKLLLEWAAQISGAIVGAMVVNKLAWSPDPKVWTAEAPMAGMNATFVDYRLQQCFSPPVNMPQASVYGLETLATFLLISVVLATAVDPSGMEAPGASSTRFGIVAPLAIGLSLWAAAQSVGLWTGGALNTARVIGPAVAAKCPHKWKFFGSYVGAHATAACAAALMHGLKMEVHNYYSGCSPKKPGGGWRLGRRTKYDEMLSNTEAAE